MYTTVLTIHSWLRWVALLLAIAATINAFREDSDLSQRPPGAKLDSLFMAAVDVQVLAGLVLYFGLSPFTSEAFADFGGAMRNSGLRFWAVEHVALMFGVNILVRIGRVMALNAKTAAARRRRRSIAFAAALIVMVIGIPWPGLDHGRPLFRI
ncbi:MAG: hypothetical protein AB7F99_11650 [Vicinamibacterales bacterium]